MTCLAQRKLALCMPWGTARRRLAQPLQPGRAPCLPQGWLRDPVTVRVGSRMRIPSGLQHRCIVVDEGAKVAAMCRQIRADLRGCVIR